MSKDSEPPTPADLTPETPVDWNIEYVYGDKALGIKPPETRSRTVGVKQLYKEADTGEDDSVTSDAT